MNVLRQATAVTVQLGPFLDATDGVTPETALSPTVQVSIDGAAFVARDSVSAITHDADGFYRVPLSTIDTGDVLTGRLVLKSFVAGALPVWHEFTIVPPAVYDALFGPVGDLLPVNTTQWLGTALATPDTVGYPKVTIKDGTGAGELDTASGVVLASVTAVTTTERNAIADALLDRAVSEPAGIFTWPASLRTIVAWLGILSRNKMTQTSTTQIVRNDADSSNVASSTHSDDGTTFTRGEWS